MNLERMVVARRKLEGGKDPEDISKELGFMSINSFYRQFLKFYQTTPVQFQNQLRIFDPIRFAEAEQMANQPGKAGRPKRGRRR